MIEIYPNQALAFDYTARECAIGTRYCQPVKQTDSYMIQGRVTTLCNSNLAVDPEFLSNSWGALGTGFSISGGRLTYGGAGALTVAQPSTYTLGLTSGRAYKIRFKVVVTDTGDCEADEGWWIKINNQFIKLPNVTLGGGSSESIETSLLFLPTSVSTDIPTIGTNNLTIRFYVEYLYVEQFSVPEVMLVNSSGVDLTPTSQVTYYANTDSGITYCTFHIVVDFSTLSGGVDGCYLVKICDALWETVYIGVVYVTGINNITNGDFEDTGTWSYGTDWSRVAAMIGFKAQLTASGSSGELSQEVTLCGGIKYELAFDLSGTASISLQCSARAGTTALGNFGAAGSYTAEIDLSALTGSQTITIGFSKGVASQNGDVIEIDNITLTALPMDEQDGLCFTTECIKIGEPDCTILMTADNNDAAFGFDYSNGFIHSLRVTGIYDVTGYPEEAETFNYSNNDNTILYGRSEKELTVFIGDAPEYIHDCVRHLRLHDTFTIDGSEFIKVSGYDLNRRKTSDNKQATFTVKEKQGIAPNYRLS